MALDLIPFVAIRWSEATRRVRGAEKILEGVRMLLEVGSTNLAELGLDVLDRPGVTRCE